MDHIDAIVFAIEALGLKIGDNDLERRAKASFVEHALTLVGYKIVTPDEIAVLVEALQHTRDKSLRYDEMETLLKRLKRKPDPPADHGSVIRKNL